MKDTILITGGSGLLAVNWAVTMRGRCEVVLGTHERQVALEGIVTRQLKLDSVKELAGHLDQVMPGLVIHTAGLTSVEACENNPELARHVNADLAENVASACTRLDLPMVHISTDHLFAGDTPLVGENQPVAPQNVYARTKAEAEVRVLNVHPQSLIVRTNFYGWGTSYRHSFSDVIVNALRQGKSITLFQDVFYTPILIERLVNVVHELVSRNVAGVCNVVGDERISKYQFGRKIADQFKLDAGLIKPGNLSDQDDLSKRPMEMSLSNSKVCNLLGKSLGDVDTHLQELSGQFEIGVAKEIETL